MLPSILKPFQCKFWHSVAASMTLSCVLLGRIAVVYLLHPMHSRSNCFLYQQDTVAFLALDFCYERIFDGFNFVIKPCASHTLLPMKWTTEKENFNYETLLKMLGVKESNRSNVVL